MFSHINYIMYEKVLIVKRKYKYLPEIWMCFSVRCLSIASSTTANAYGIFWHVSKRNKWYRSLRTFCKTSGLSIYAVAAVRICSSSASPDIWKKNWKEFFKGLHFIHWLATALLAETQCLCMHKDTIMILYDRCNYLYEENNNRDALR